MAVQYDTDYWTPEAVQARLAEAADTLRRMRFSGLRPGSHKNNWPEVVQDFWDAYSRESVKDGRLATPKPEAIDRMDEALPWLYFVRDTTARGALWGMACGYSDRRISRVLGVSRYHVQRLQGDGLERLAKFLNGRL